MPLQLNNMIENENLIYFFVAANKEVEDVFLKGKKKEKDCKEKEKEIEEKSVQLRMKDIGEKKRRNR